MKKFIAISLTMVLTFLSTISAWAGYRHGIDEYNTKMVQDRDQISQLPFKKAWEYSLGGQVHSQPIIVNDPKNDLFAIFVQSGKDLVKLEYRNANLTTPPKVTRLQNVTSHEMPSDSTPTYHVNSEGEPRLYVATRDHLLLAINPITMEVIWNKIITAKNQPEKRYRITSSPLVFNYNGRTLISLGTATGDRTGEPNQLNDNGFFVYEDMGTDMREMSRMQMNGEIIGSPIYHNGVIMVTENTGAAQSQLIRYDVAKGRIINNPELTLNAGVETSPMLEKGTNSFIYLADRAGRFYKYHADISRGLVHKNTDALPGSLVQQSPTLGKNHVFLNIRDYKSSGKGAILAINKSTGQTVKTIQLDSKLHNSLFWQPKANEDGYLIIFEANGTIQFRRAGGDFAQIDWFKDASGTTHKTQKVAPVDANVVSHLNMHDNLLTVVDGTGKLHVYKAFRPYDLVVKKLEVVGKELKNVKPGEQITLRATLENTGDENYTTDVQFFSQRFGNPTAEAIGSSKTVTLPSRKNDIVVEQTVTVPNQLQEFRVKINTNKNQPSGEYSYNNNEKALGYRIDLQLTGMKLSKTALGKDENDVIVHLNALALPLDPMPSGTVINTSIEVNVDSKVFVQEVSLPVNVKTALDLKVNVNGIDRKTKKIVAVTAMVNKQWTIEEPATPVSVKENNYKGPLLLRLDLAGDIIAEALTFKQEVLTGETINIKGRVKHLVNEEQPVEIYFYANGREIHKIIPTFKANETKDVSFLWKAPSSSTSLSITMRIDPEGKAVDNNRSNNVLSELVNVQSPSPPNTCGPNKDTENWTVTYWIITGYPTKTSSYTYTDAEGNEQTGTYTYTDYSHPIWASRDVTYTESLTHSINVNTKQGIPTDPKNPKESDYESRGSWKIIPESKKNGWEPNEVTRAGYGFEVTVNLDYSNNWETKVPSGLADTARPFGANNYQGTLKPIEVKAEFWDTKNRYIGSEILEKTSGNNTTGTWQLPLKAHKTELGKTIHERKHYIAPSTTDGEYKVKITTRYQGASGELTVCNTKSVRVFGTMYDDFYQSSDR